jgi:hypothetical protein
MSSQKITNVLKTIADDKKLLDVFVRAGKGFNFERELAESVSIQGFFKLPTDANKIIALLVNLLYEFDSGKRSFVDFVIRCFKSDRESEAYSKFTETFASALLSQYKIALTVEHLEKNENADSEAERESKIFEIFSEKAKLLLAAFADKTLKSRLTSTQIEISLFLIDALAHAISIADKKMIKLGKVALNLALSNHIEFSDLFISLDHLLAVI